MPDQLNALVPIVHAGATWFMVGLIWFVQVVHYPLMGSVPDQAGTSYARSHQRRTSWIVAPVMLIEAITAAALFWHPLGRFNGTPLLWTGLSLLLVIWISTFGVLVPLHERLAREHHPSVVRGLVAANWVRTIAWTARGIVALMLLG